MLRIAEQREHVFLLVRLVSGERFNDGFGREPLMNEERQGRHIERKPFRLTSPVEEGLAQALELRCSGLRFFEALGIEVSVSPCSRAGFLASQSSADESDES